LNEFLGSGKQVAFDAVFTGDDDAAVGVLKALHQYGYKILMMSLSWDLMI